MAGASRDFELAVYNFATAINPNAKVIFDHKVPDRDTGTLRQVDVWIETMIGGHWPISILASCKLQRRKVNISQVGTFCDEVRSTGAGYGVIYSSSGFTKGAFAKAKTNGLACCRLYRGESADMPKALYFRSFLSKTSVHLSLAGPITIDGVHTWNDVLDLAVSAGSAQSTVLDRIAERYFAQEQASITLALNKLRFPEPWQSMHTFSLSVDPVQQFQVQLAVRWKRYQGTTEAHLLNGSY